VKPLTPQELEAKLRAIGAQRYHRLHPFHALLHGGKCTKGQVQAWALNRYYYQWAMLDALYHAYVAPKHIPPGAFVPEEGRSG
jgi:pyrroloquinoline quinone (PQQ) biosynthesis protein C